MIYLISFLQAILIGVAFYLIKLIKSFGTKYVETKAQNLATREDIGEITKIVEEIKNKFQVENEQLKSSLSVLSQNFISIKALERDALLATHKAHSEWLNCMANFGLASYTYESYKELDSFIHQLEEKQLSVDVAVDHLYIFMHDEEIRKLLGKVKNGGIELQGSIIQFIIKFQSNAKQRNIICKEKTNDEILSITTNYHQTQNLVIDQQLSERNRVHSLFYNDFINYTKLTGARIIELIQ